MKSYRIHFHCLKHICCFVCIKTLTKASVYCKAHFLLQHEVLTHSGAAHFLYVSVFTTHLNEPRSWWKRVYVWAFLLFPWNILNLPLVECPVCNAFCHHRGALKLHIKSLTHMQQFEVMQIVCCCFCCCFCFVFADRYRLTVAFRMHSLSLFQTFDSSSKDRVQLVVVFKSSVIQVRSTKPGMFCRSNTLNSLSHDHLSACRPTLIL